MVLLNINKVYKKKMLQRNKLSADLGVNDPRHSENNIAEKNATYIIS